MNSFDVFDTIITRTVATPRGIFSQMQKELLDNESYRNISYYIRSNFFNLRIQSEELANFNFQQNGLEETTLEQIYQAMALNGSLDKKTISLLMELEKNTELENVVPITHTISHIKQLLKDGEKIVLISDMYLDRNTIQRMLLKADSIFSKLPLYVSSEYKKSKRSGSLYKVVKDIELCDYNQWVHIGDNPHSDYQIPSDLGIHAIRFEYENLLPCEMAEVEKNEGDLFTQITIGTARNTRLFFSHSEAKSYGITLGGTLLFPYVWWLLHESLKKGYKRLYFIARDGFILKRIADKIICKNHYDIQTKYIYGSRQAWRMASLSKTNTHLKDIFESSYVLHANTLGEIADILGLSVEFICDMFNIKYSPNMKITKPLIDYFSRSLLEYESEWLDILTYRHKESRELAIDYIKQEVNLNDENFAFVELAGSGLTQECLKNIMQDFYPNPIPTFFFKLDKVVHDTDCKFYVYLPSLLYLHVVIEMLCRAPHGQTTGYRRTEGKVEPVFDTTDVPALHSHGIMDYIEGVDDFASEYLEIITKKNLYPNNTSLIINYLNYITKTPDDSLLEFIGGMPNGVTGREKEVVEFAPKLTQNQISSIFMTDTNTPKERYYKGSAIEYSILRSGKGIQEDILQYITQRDSRLSSNTTINYEKNFPLEILKDKVALYAAGKVGHCLHRVISLLPNVTVTAWVDNNYKELKDQGLPVQPPEQLSNAEYDQLIICVLSQVKAYEIQDSLMNRGIPGKKIIWVNLLIR